ncbi:flagellar motor protein MotD [Rhodanobacter sp. MP7CTX1]|uniref:flagellar motor protein MotD n=1 Tax=Rhodanobacter sp. MP7CTX1 TaxID=2723084 RepID=UPI001612DC6C|nr:flagellar motor protein MotD [Rhodanobacter sp. MP7CTX1]MBB6186228.1 chemotaxis protein MotB [Rhodanobacter sp. MP7CTX1]
MRRKRHEDHVNHEAWVIPYADLLTLLLALFVVLYAMSSVNTTKYRALAQAISAAFNGSQQVIHPLQPNNPQASLTLPAGVPSPVPSAPLAKMLMSIPAQQMMAPIKEHASQASRNKLNSEQQDLERIRSQVEHALQPLIDKNMVVVRRTTSWLEIEIRTDILFPSGVATVSPSANQVLTSLGEILAPFANPLRIEGYTDDVPINTALYPSNWELSAARAASVARLFADHGVDPDRLGIVGWGQYHPSADNVSQDGRNRNRRVLVVVLSNRAAPQRFYSNSDQIENTADADPVAPDGHAPVPVATSPPSTSPPPTGAVEARAAAPVAPTAPVAAPGPVVDMPVAAGNIGTATIATSPLLLMPDTKD